MRSQSWGTRVSLKHGRRPHFLDHASPSAAPQGRKGELLAELLTDFPESFGTAAGEARREVFLAKPQFTGTAAEARAITVTRSSEAKIRLATEGR